MKVLHLTAEPTIILGAPYLEQGLPVYVSETVTGHSLSPPVYGQVRVVVGESVAR
jgi:hypothetical protein